MFWKVNIFRRLEWASGWRAQAEGSEEMNQHTSGFGLFPAFFDNDKNIVDKTIADSEDLSDVFSTLASIQLKCSFLTLTTVIEKKKEKSITSKSSFF